MLSKRAFFACWYRTGAGSQSHPTNLPTQIFIGCEPDKQGCGVVDIYDDGVGLREDFDEKKHGGTGLRLIRALTNQIGVTLKIESSNLGLRFRLTLPK